MMEAQRFHVAAVETTKHSHQGRIAGLCGKRGPVRLRLGPPEPRQITFEGHTIHFTGPIDNWCHDCLLLFDEHAEAGRIESVAMANRKTEWRGRGGYVWRGPEEALSEWQRTRIQRRVEMVCVPKIRAANTDRRKRVA
jgi:hypothetical protein